MLLANDAGIRTIAEQVWRNYQANPLEQVYLFITPQGASPVRIWCGLMCPDNNGKRCGRSPLKGNRGLDALTQSIKGRVASCLEQRQRKAQQRKQRRVVGEVDGHQISASVLASIRTMYGMELADLEALWRACGGACSICHKPLVLRSREASRSEIANIDHCHVTGKVRGILCGSCNSMCGLGRDNPALLRRGAEYLEGFVTPKSNGSKPPPVPEPEPAIPISYRQGCRCLAAKAWAIWDNYGQAQLCLLVRETRHGVEAMVCSVYSNWSCVIRKWNLNARKDSEEAQAWHFEAKLAPWKGRIAFPDFMPCSE